MGKFMPLSEIVRDYHETMDRHKLDRELVPYPFRDQAGMLAIARYGPRIIDEQPGLINIAALALSMRPRVVVHRIAPGAVKAVHETDLHTLPGEPPMLLRRPFIVEAKRIPGEYLFDQTVCLAGYPMDEHIFLLGLDYPDGLMVVRWTPEWREMDLEEGIPMPDNSPLIDNVDAHHDWAREAVRFALVLALHLEAQQSPLEVRDDIAASRRYRHPGQSQSSPSKNTRKPEWLVRRISLTRITRSVSSISSGGTSKDETDTRGSNLLPATVMVRGHLRRQPYGPGRSQRRWVYVEAYEARRWVAPKPLRIDINE